MTNDNLDNPSINKAYTLFWILFATFRNNAYILQSLMISMALSGDVDGNGVVNVADHVKLSDIIMKQDN